MLKPSTLSAFATVLLLFCPMISAQPVAVAPESFKVGAFEFHCPKGWSWIPAGGMRKAHLRTPAESGVTPADITFFHFGPGQGGGVQQNVDRWFGQFAEPKDKIGAEIAMVKMGPVNVTLVRAKGTFNSGMPGSSSTPMPGYSLQGAILESAEGDVFIKMTGPEASVSAAADAFQAMIRAACEPRA